MTSTYMDARTYGIGTLISQRGFFSVPDHQRDFAWTDDVVAQFLDDVTAAVDHGSPDYFLGLLVLVTPEQQKGSIILDGQQRLATATMVYSAIRQWLTTAGLEKDATKVQSDFIGLTELGEEQDRPRIELNVTNRAWFRELVVNKCTDDLLEDRRREAGRFSSNRRLVEAAIVCRKRINDLAKSAGTDPKQQAAKLYQLSNYLRDNVKVVCVDVPSTANAYVIFEALNDRGLDLSVLDLVKNYMFGKAEGRLPEVEADWLRMVTQIGDRRADDFLKTFWTSRFGRIQRGKLFDAWREKYVGKLEVVQLAKDLPVVAERFAALDMPDHDVWTDYSKACKERIKVLSVLGNQQTRAIVLAALEKFTPERMEQLLQYLVVLTVRYQTVGKGRTGALEIVSARAAEKLYRGELNSAMKVWKELSSIVPNDNEFKLSISQYSESDAAKARYILWALETVVVGKNGKGDIYGSSAYESLTLEHVFPRNPSNEWSAEIQVEPGLRTYVHRLGNLCLVEEALNRKASSHGFKKKVSTIYSKSSLRLTSQMATGYREWNCSNIDSRQQAMAELAVQAWPLPN